MDFALGRLLGHCLESEEQHTFTRYTHTRRRRCSKPLAFLCGTLVIMPLVPSLRGQCSSTTDYTNTIDLGFDGLADLSTNLNSFGVSFTGATVLACGGSLNCTAFPPFSGRNVIYDSGNGVIIATFNPAVTGLVCMVSARITGNRSITMTAFDAKNNVLGMTDTGGANYVGVGTPNLLLSITSNGAPIATVTFHDDGNTYTVDDFTFSATEYVIILDPGHGQILGTDNVYHYQRPASPTYGLHEDNLTLSIAQSAGAQLQADGYTVYFTRTGITASGAYGGAPKGCNDTPTGIRGYFAPPYSLCISDLKQRLAWAEDQDADVLVSVHTNGLFTVLGFPLFPKNGTLANYGLYDDAGTLASDLVSQVTALGTNNLGTSVSSDIIIKSPDIPSSLIEVAYDNSTTPDSSGLSDEQRLNDPTFRQNAGIAIAKAIEQFITNVLNKE